MDSKKWLQLNFTLPKEPSRVRVSVWRKLTKAGAVNIGQSLWLLPASDAHKQVFNEISEEILQNNGEAYVLESSFLSTGNATDIRDVFSAARDEEYREFLGKCDDFHHEIEKETAKDNFSFAEIDENERELSKLEDWLETIVREDRFLGDPMDRAVIAEAERRGIDRMALQEEYGIVSEGGFDEATRTFQSSYTKGSHALSLVKGAPKASSRSPSLMQKCNGSWTRP